MRITNKAGLPDPIVRAVENDPYSKGTADYSITGLLRPPWQAMLMERHGKEISEDAGDRIWSLVGQSIHEILRRAADGNKDGLAEERLYADIGTARVSGEFDHFDLDESLLTDYKVTSVWKVVHKDYAEWEAQLNGYALLARINGIEVRALQIVAILRDWSKGEARRNPDYPRSQVARIPIRLWSDTEARIYYGERVGAHQSWRVEGVEPEVCTPEERWHGADKWAVKSPGVKKARRVLDSEADAKAWAASHMVGKKREIEYRPGLDKRCAGYCAVSDFCSWWAANRPKEDNNA